MIAAAQALDKTFIAAVNSGDTEKLAEVICRSPADAISTVAYSAALNLLYENHRPGLCLSSCLEAIQISATRLSECIPCDGMLSRRSQT